MAERKALEKASWLARNLDRIQGEEVLEGVLEGLVAHGEKIGEAPEILATKRQQLTETKRIISTARQARQN